MGANVKLHLGDCLEVLKTFESNSIDAVVTDPPYGLAFMGKRWDYDVPSVEIWREVLRVLKPGGHLLSFGGTRTYHRMVVNIEDAGFEIRDQLQWLYSQGFPKSLDISKAIDKAAGAEREVVGKVEQHDIRNASLVGKVGKVEVNITIPSTDLAKKWSGWGSSLKPANEPIVLARKPIAEKNVAANVLKYGTGGLNIDAGRIGEEQTITRRNGNSGAHGRYGKDNRVFERLNPPGRFPSNVLLDEEAAKLLDEQTAHLYGAGSVRPGASRFFYVAKASKRERNAGLEGMPKGTPGKWRNQKSEAKRNGATRENVHPTIKPIKLMQYLIKLVTPPGGVVLDPFMGSGSTGCAAVQLGFNFIGIEREKEYFEIAERRIEFHQVWPESDDDEEKESSEGDEHKQIELPLG